MECVRNAQNRSQTERNNKRMSLQSTHKMAQNTQSHVHTYKLEYNNNMYVPLRSFRSPVFSLRPSVPIGPKVGPKVNKHLFLSYHKIYDLFQRNIISFPCPCLSFLH